MDNFKSQDLRKDYPNLDIWLPGDNAKSVVYENVQGNLKTALEENFGEIISIPKNASLQDIEQLLQDPDVRFFAGRSELKLPAEQIAHAKGLALLAKCCVGVDGIDMKATKEKGIILFNSPDAAKNAVAEMAVLYAIDVCRNVIGSNLRTCLGDTFEKEAEGRRELASMKVGIVGAGNIGKLSATKLLPLAQGVYMYDDGENSAQKIAEVQGAQQAQSLDELLSICDIILIHTDDKNTKGESNKDLITAERLEGKEVFGVINLARGNIARVEELQKAVDLGYIQRMRVDVYGKEQEKAKRWESPLRREHVDSGAALGSAHIGASTEETQKKIGELIIKKIMGFYKYGDIRTGVNFKTNKFVGDTRHQASLFFQHKNERGSLLKLIQAVSDSGVDCGNTAQHDMWSNGKGNPVTKLSWGTTRIDTDEITESQIGSIIEEIMKNSSDLLQRFRMVRH